MKGPVPIQVSSPVR